MSQNCVKNAFAKMKRNVPLKNAHGQGRKRATTSSDDRCLLQLCKQDRIKTSHQLSSEWLLSSGKIVSDSTVRHRLLESGYKSHTAKPKPIRTAVQKQKRLSFEKGHINWLSDDWNKVIWSDESHFELFNRKSRTFIKRKPNEPDLPFSFISRLQKGGSSISLWECMTSTGVGPVIFYDGRMNARSYVQLIDDALSAFINNSFGTSLGGFWYMQDNARPHVSDFAKKFFERNKIPLLEWPSTSPDLNPIENLWDMIDNQLRTMHPKNLMELKQMIEEIWAKFTSAT